MKIFKVLTDEELSKEPAEPVEEITKEIKDIAIDMCVTMKSKGGIGLAAPQVGIAKRIIVVNASTYSDAHFCTFMINPEILEVEGEQEVDEGCLSFPGKFKKIKRNKVVKVKYLNTQGQELTQVFRGLPAQVIMHEIDHLDGITMFDKKGYKL
jgi:peptide deformylase